LDHEGELMKFDIVRRDNKQSVLVSTHQDFRTALAQKDKLGPGHEVIAVGGVARQRGEAGK